MRTVSLITFVPVFGVAAAVDAQSYPTASSIVIRLNSELVRALRQPEAKAWFLEQGGEVIGDDPEDFARVVRADYAH